MVFILYLEALKRSAVRTRKFVSSTIVGKKNNGNNLNAQYIYVYI